MQHRAGFVNIIGRPNVGKSTLMNQLVGERISIITSKAQTTRHRIMGIVNDEDFQIVYSDTPGILDPKYKLHEGMMKFVGGAFTDADTLLLVTSEDETPANYESELAKIQKIEASVFVLINKVDLSSQERIIRLIEKWKIAAPEASVAAISALHGFNLDELLGKIVASLPESPPYFPKDELTDKPLRFFMAEIIREKILMNYKQEIPYSCEVVIESYEEEGRMIRIRSLIIVSRESQKMIVIGQGGKSLKKVGTEARKDMEAFINRKVFLELFVKVDKNWRDDEQKLRRYGYFE